MYFVQILCEMDNDDEEAYIGLMQENMNRIIDVVAPGGDPAAANYKVIHHVSLVPYIPEDPLRRREDAEVL